MVTAPISLALLLSLAVPLPHPPHLRPPHGPARFIGRPARSVASGVKMTVAGAILTGLGTGFGALGVLGLVAAADGTKSSRDLAVLGWTSAGFGMLMGAIGLPLLIVGIVNLARPRLALTVSSQGMLAVQF